MGKGARQAHNNGPLPDCTERMRGKHDIETFHTWLFAKVTLRSCDERVESTDRKVEDVVDKRVNLDTFILNRLPIARRCAGLYTLQSMAPPGVGVQYT